MSDKVLKSLESLKAIYTGKQFATAEKDNETQFSRKDKTKACLALAEAISEENSSSRKPDKEGKFGEALSMSILYLLRACGDSDTEVNLTADDAIRRIIKDVYGSYLERIVDALLKGMLQASNASSRSQRFALLHVAEACQHLKISKTRPFVVRLTPLLTQLVEAGDVSVLDVIGQATQKLMSKVGFFLDLTEFHQIFEALVALLASTTDKVRRSAATAIQHLCAYTPHCPFDEVCGTLHHAAKREIKISDHRPVNAPFKGAFKPANENALSGQVTAFLQLSDVILEAANKRRETGATLWHAYVDMALDLVLHCLCAFSPNILAASLDLLQRVHITFGAFADFWTRKSEMVMHHTHSLLRLLTSPVIAITAKRDVLSALSLFARSPNTVGPFLDACFNYAVPAETKNGEQPFQSALDYVFSLIEHEDYTIRGNTGILMASLAVGCLKTDIDLDSLAARRIAEGPSLLLSDPPSFAFEMDQPPVSPPSESETVLMAAAAVGQPPVEGRLSTLESFPSFSEETGTATNNPFDTASQVSTSHDLLGTESVDLSASRPDTGAQSDHDEMTHEDEVEDGEDGPTPFEEDLFGVPVEPSFHPASTGPSSSRTTAYIPPFFHLPKPAVDASDPFAAPPPPSKASAEVGDFIHRVVELLTEQLEEEEMALGRKVFCEALVILLPALLSFSESSNSKIAKDAKKGCTPFDVAHAVDAIRSLRRVLVEIGKTESQLWNLTTEVLGLIGAVNFTFLAYYESKAIPETHSATFLRDDSSISVQRLAHDYILKNLGSDDQRVRQKAADVLLRFLQTAFFQRLHANTSLLVLCATFQEPKEFDLSVNLMANLSILVPELIQRLNNSYGNARSGVLSALCAIAKTCASVDTDCVTLVRNDAPNPLSVYARDLLHISLELLKHSSVIADLETHTLLVQLVGLLHVKTDLDKEEGSEEVMLYLHAVLSMLGDIKAGKKESKAMFMEATMHAKLMSNLSGTRSQRSGEAKFLLFLESVLKAVYFFTRYGRRSVLVANLEPLLSCLAVHVDEDLHHCLLCVQQLFVCAFSPAGVSTFATHLSAANSAVSQLPPSLYAVFSSPDEPTPSMEPSHERTDSSSTQVSEQQSLDEVPKSKIVLFQPLVARAIRMYKNTNSVDLQRIILRLMCELVTVGIDFSKLDKDGSFVKFVTRQALELDQALQEPHRILAHIHEFLAVLWATSSLPPEIVNEKNLVMAVTMCVGSSDWRPAYFFPALKPLVKQIFMPPLETETPAAEMPLEDLTAADLGPLKESLLEMMLQNLHVPTCCTLLRGLLDDLVDTDPEASRLVSDRVLLAMLSKFATQRTLPHSEDLIQNLTSLFGVVSSLNTVSLDACAPSVLRVLEYLTAEYSQATVPLTHLDPTAATSLDDDDPFADPVRVPSIASSQNQKLNAEFIFRAALTIQVASRLRLSFVGAQDTIILSPLPSAWSVAKRAIDLLACCYEAHSTFLGEQLDALLVSAQQATRALVRSLQLQTPSLALGKDSSSSFNVSASTFDGFGGEPASLSDDFGYLSSEASHAAEPKYSRLCVEDANSLLSVFARLQDLTTTIRRAPFGVNNEPADIPTALLIGHTRVAVKLSECAMDALSGVQEGDVSALQTVLCGFESLTGLVSEQLHRLISAASSRAAAFKDTFGESYRESYTFTREAHERAVLCLFCELAALFIGGDLPDSESFLRAMPLWTASLWSRISANLNEPSVHQFLSVLRSVQRVVSPSLSAFVRDALASLLGTDEAMQVLGGGGQPHSGSTGKRLTILRKILGMLDECAIATHELIEVIMEQYALSSRKLERKLLESMLVNLFDLHAATNPSDTADSLGHSKMAAMRQKFSEKKASLTDLAQAYTKAQNCARKVDGGHTLETVSSETIVEYIYKHILAGRELTHKHAPYGISMLSSASAEAVLSTPATLDLRLLSNVSVCKSTPEYKHEIIRLTWGLLENLKVQNDYDPSAKFSSAPTLIALAAALDACIRYPEFYSFFKRHAASSQSTPLSSPLNNHASNPFFDDTFGFDSQSPNVSRSTSAQSHQKGSQEEMKQYCALSLWFCTTVIDVYLHSAQRGTVAPGDLDTILKAVGRVLVGFPVIIFRAMTLPFYTFALRVCKLFAALTNIKDLAVSGALATNAEALQKEFEDLLVKVMALSASHMDSTSPQRVQPLGALPYALPHHVDSMIQIFFAFAQMHTAAIYEEFLDADQMEQALAMEDFAFIRRASILFSKAPPATDSLYEKLWCSFYTVLTRPVFGGPEEEAQAERFQCLAIEAVVSMFIAGTALGLQSNHLLPFVREFKTSYYTHYANGISLTKLLRTIDDSRTYHAATTAEPPLKLLQRAVAPPPPVVTAFLVYLDSCVGATVNLHRSQLQSQPDGGQDTPSGISPSGSHSSLPITPNSGDPRLSVDTPDHPMLGDPTGELQFPSVAGSGGAAFSARPVSAGVMRQIARACLLVSCRFEVEGDFEWMFRIVSTMVQDATNASDWLLRPYLLLGLAKAVCNMRQPPAGANELLSQLILECLPSQEWCVRTATYNAIVHVCRVKRTAVLNQVLPLVNERVLSSLRKSRIIHIQKMLLRLVFSLIEWFPREANEVGFSKNTLECVMNLASQQDTPLPVLEHIYGGLERLLSNFSFPHTQRQIISSITTLPKYPPVPRKAPGTPSPAQTTIAVGKSPSLQFLAEKLMDPTRPSIDSSQSRARPSTDTERPPVPPSPSSSASADKKKGFDFKFSFSGSKTESGSKPPTAPLPPPPSTAAQTTTPPAVEAQPAKDKIGSKFSFGSGDKKKESEKEKQPTAAAAATTTPTAQATPTKEESNFFGRLRRGTVLADAQKSAPPSPAPAPPPATVSTPSTPEHKPTGKFDGLFSFGKKDVESSPSNAPLLGGKEREHLAVPPPSPSPAPPAEPASGVLATPTGASRPKVQIQQPETGSQPLPPSRSASGSALPKSATIDSSVSMFFSEPREAPPPSASYADLFSDVLDEKSLLVLKLLLTNMYTSAPHQPPAQARGEPPRPRRIVIDDLDEKSRQNVLDLLERIKGETSRASELILRALPQLLEDFDRLEEVLPLVLNNFRSNRTHPLLLGHILRWAMPSIIPSGGQPALSPHSELTSSAPLPTITLDPSKEDDDVEYEIDVAKQSTEQTRMLAEDQLQSPPKIAPGAVAKSPSYMGSKTTPRTAATDVLPKPLALAVDDRARPRSESTLLQHPPVATSRARDPRPDDAQLKKMLLLTVLESIPLKAPVSHALWGLFSFFTSVLAVTTTQDFAALFMEFVAMVGPPIQPLQPTKEGPPPAAHTVPSDEHTLSPQFQEAFLLVAVLFERATRSVPELEMYKPSLISVLQRLQTSSTLAKNLLSFFTTQEFPSQALAPTVKSPSSSVSDLAFFEGVRSVSTNFVDF